MKPGDKDHYAEALWVTLDRIAKKPSEFSLAEIGSYARLASDALRPVTKPSRPPAIEGQRTVEEAVEESGAGYIRTIGRPSAKDL
jgi:hypothetical protein